MTFHLTRRSCLDVIYGVETDVSLTGFLGLFGETDGRFPWECWLLFWLCIGGVVEEENMDPIGFCHYTTIPRMVHKGQDQTDNINLCISPTSLQFLFLIFLASSSPF